MPYPPRFESLVELAQYLRSPQGCPWDRKQTMDSVCEFLREESEELIEAIRENDPHHISEEIGDVLMNLALLIAIGQEQKHFDHDQVLTKIIDKIISRHTWVFGNDKITDPDQALKQWKKNKKKENDK